MDLRFPADGDIEIPDIPYEPGEGYSCCCLAVSLKLKIKKLTPRTIAFGGATSGRVRLKVQAKTRVLGDPNGAPIQKCDLEFWEIHTAAKGPRDELEGAVVYPGGWMDAAGSGRFPKSASWMTQITGMTCATGDDEIIIDDSPKAQVAELQAVTERWGLVVLRSGCPGGPTKKRFWYMKVTFKAEPPVVIWPPEAKDEESGEPVPAEDVGDGAAEPFEGPPAGTDPYGPRAPVSNPKYPKAPVGAK